MAGRQGAKVLSNAFVVCEDKDKVCLGVILYSFLSLSLRCFYIDNMCMRWQVMILWNGELVRWDRWYAWTGVHLCLLVYSCNFWSMWLSSRGRNRGQGAEGLLRSRSPLMLYAMYWNDSGYQMSCHVFILINKFNQFLCSNEGDKRQHWSAWSLWSSKCKLSSPSHVCKPLK